MTKAYICSQCGQEVNKYKDQCPYCKVSGDNYVEKLYGSYDEDSYDDYPTDDYMD